ncbi:MAG: hypothetical protein K6G26_00030 [Lachnospiraceae bacterium]|nr:hypothetical protein [Lachnospiraceae bacterium]
MGMFSHNDYKTYKCLFRFYEYLGFPTIQAYGVINYKMRYFSADYAIKTLHHSMWEDGRYDKLAEDLKKAEGKTEIEVLVKMKDEEPDKFKIDLKKFGEAIGNSDIENFELSGYLISDHSITCYEDPKDVEEFKKKGWLREKRE